MSGNVYYSTGPLENAAPNFSDVVFIKALNNEKHDKVKVKVKVYKLNGKKRLIDSFRFKLRHGSSQFRVADVSDAAQFEVQIKVKGMGGKENVLLGVFGKRSNGRLNPTHRLVHSELTVIDADSFEK